jgi:hypothetical protein
MRNINAQFSSEVRLEKLAFHLGVTFLCMESLNMFSIWLFARN